MTRPNNAVSSVPMGNTVATASFKEAIYVSSTASSTSELSMVDNNQLQQALRLLRIMLGEPNATICKETVDRTLQKHADLLRLQVHHKQQDKEYQVQKEKDQQVLTEQAAQIAKLAADLEQQKSVHATALEIKNVELDIVTKERDQKALKLQQVTWRLAKERSAGKDKAAAAAAAMAATSSLTNRAMSAEQEMTEQQETIRALEQMVEHTVSALRGKDTFLRQLMSQRNTCCECSPSTTMEEGASGTNDGADHDAMSSNLHCHIELDPSVVLSRLHKVRQGGGDRDDDSSDATPVMGQSASSGMMLLDDDEPHEEKAVVESAEEKPSATSNSTIRQVAKVRDELERTKYELRQAQEQVATLESAKGATEASHEESLKEAKAKIAQLNRVLIACNERRVEAEQKLRELGQLDEEQAAKTESLMPEQQQPPLSPTTDQEETLKQCLAETRSELAKLRSELELKSTQLDANRATNELLESQLTNANQQMKQYQQKLEVTSKQGGATRDEGTKKLVQQAAAKMAEYLRQLRKVNDNVKQSQTIVVELTSRLQDTAGQIETKSSRALAKNADQATDEVDSAEFTLSHATTARLLECATQLEVAAGQSKAFLCELNRIQNAIGQSDESAATDMLLLKARGNESSQDPHSSSSSFEEYVENVDQNEPLSNDLVGITTATKAGHESRDEDIRTRTTGSTTSLLAKIARLEQKLTLKQERLQDAERTITALESQQQQQRRLASSQQQQAAATDATTSTVLAQQEQVICQLQHELATCRANLESAMQKLNYLRTTVLSVAADDNAT
jgi:hypothetical protein